MITPKRIDQITPHLSDKDAIGNHILTMKGLLEAKGIQSEVFAESGESGLPWRPIEQYPALDHEHNILIHHYSIGSTLPDRLMRSKAFRITYYHNITPPSFFLDAEELPAFISHLKGYQQIPLVNLVSDHVWAVSEYNAEDLQRHGFKAAKILPIIRDYEALSRLPTSPAVESFLASGKKNILFVGRVVPNKAQHDLVLLTYLYKKHVDPDIRLILIGDRGSGYARKLEDICRQTGLTVSQDFAKDADVIMPGKISDEAMATVYRSSHAFVCLSDHEGFCVPIVEAMSFGLPIIAHNAAAVPQTIAHGGLIVDKENILDLVRSLKTLLNNTGAREFWSQRSRERLRDFQYDHLVNRFDDVLADALEVFRASRSLTFTEVVS